MKFKILRFLELLPWNCCPGTVALTLFLVNKEHVCSLLTRNKRVPCTVNKEQRQGNSSRATVPGQQFQGNSSRRVDDLRKRARSRPTAVQAFQPTAFP